MNTATKNRQGLMGPEHVRSLAAVETAIDLRLRVDSAQGLSAVQQAQGRANLGAAGNLIGYQIFTASGTYTKSANVTKILVELVGGGGGGRGPTGTSGNDGITAGGGAAGGYSRKLIDATAITTVAVTIGAGGAGGAAGGNNGLIGGTTSFGAHCSATGGTGGINAGGDGGVGSGGDLNCQGQPGESRSAQEGTLVSSGAGGPSAFAGGGRGARFGGTAAGAGEKGSGGGGGYNNTAGGNGGNGLVIVWEFA
ncbi:glycine-rich domain-containing protein [Mycoplana ramosa]|uniref:Glycine-rich domain-containing protein n=1 Tax=Mycoplana ramosa TaxID=40837 RepID=A0ABW3YWK4_MYCRA